MASANGPANGGTQVNGKEPEWGFCVLKGGENHDGSSERSTGMGERAFGLVSSSLGVINRPDSPRD